MALSLSLAAPCRTSCLFYCNCVSNVDDWNKDIGTLIGRHCCTRTLNTKKCTCLIPKAFAVHLRSNCHPTAYLLFPSSETENNATRLSLLDVSVFVLNLMASKSETVTTLVSTNAKVLRIIHELLSSFLW